MLQESVRVECSHRQAGFFVVLCGSRISSIEQRLEICLISFTLSSFNSFQVVGLKVKVDILTYQVAFLLLLVLTIIHHQVNQCESCE